MSQRKVIKIEEAKCNGCGLCLPNCPEGAIQIIEGKARLISDLFCDGLGACIGHCPEGAITIEERPAQEYDEKKVMENIVRQGDNVIVAHLRHLKEHGQHQLLQQAREYLKERKIEIPVPAGHEIAGGCPGSKVMDFRNQEKVPPRNHIAPSGESELRQWPVQIKLVPPNAPYLNNADLLIAADCVPFAYADFHQDLLKGKILLVGCPKLDDTQLYQQKLTQIFQNNHLESVTYVHMEVPCCSGLISVIRSAINSGGREIPFKLITISIKGEKLAS